MSKLDRNVPSPCSQTAATGALTGTAKDSSGAVVPNATVTVTNIGTGQARTATTEADGTYKFGLLAPGDYKLKFEATGFSKLEVPSVSIVVTETTVLDQIMQVGAQTQQIEVHGEAEAVLRFQILEVIRWLGSVDILKKR